MSVNWPAHFELLNFDPHLCKKSGMKNTECLVIITRVYNKEEKELFLRIEKLQKELLGEESRNNLAIFDVEQQELRATEEFISESTEEYGKDLSFKVIDADGIATTPVKVRKMTKEDVAHIQALIRAILNAMYAPQKQTKKAEGTGGTQEVSATHAPAAHTPLPRVSRSRNSSETSAEKRAKEKQAVEKYHTREWHKKEERRWEKQQDARDKTKTAHREILKEEIAKDKIKKEPFKKS